LANSKDSKSVALIWNYEMGNDNFAQATVLYLSGGSRLAENGARFLFLHTLLFCIFAMALIY
jgi:hypothetical protein